MHSFTGGDDGAEPWGGLTYCNGRLYGMASGGGRSQQGTIYGLDPTGSGFAVIHDFTKEQGNYESLLVSGGTLYGCTKAGGVFGPGSVFSIKTDGTSYTTLHSFTGGDGSNPEALLLSSNVLYGTTLFGGGFSSGTLFRLKFLPQLGVVQSNEGMILTWPANYAGFDYSGYTLQSATNLTSPIWSTNLPAPVVVNGQFTLTNSISGSQQFFRLSQ